MRDLLRLPPISIRTVLGLGAVAAFWIAIVGLQQGHSPLDQARILSDWIGVGGDWARKASSWIGQRRDVARLIATLMLLGGTIGLVVSEPRAIVGDAPGAYTTAGSYAVLMQVGAGPASSALLAVGGAIAGAFGARYLASEKNCRPVGESLASAAVEQVAVVLGPALLLSVFFVRPARR